MKQARPSGGKGSKRATLKDVAALAGVSPMTVSNVVNGRLSGYNHATRDKVLWAIRSTKYRPDVAARSLRTDKRMAVGMLVVQEERLFLADPYITNLLDGLCAGLNQHGYSMVLQGLAANEVPHAPLVRQLHTDGLCILMAGAYNPKSALAEALGSLGQPTVLFQQNYSDAKGDVCVLRQDDFEGGRMLSAHLIERGARSIVAVFPQLHWPAMKARIDGIRHSVDAAGQSVSLTVLTSIDETPVATEGALAGYLSGGDTFDAVIAGNDQMAIAAHRMLARRGKKIPDDVRVAGFNGFSFIDYLETRLTTVRSPAFQLGSLGAHHIIRRIETGAFETTSVVLPVDFVPGQTT
jgi:LacI family transcriptional regulator